MTITHPLVTMAWAAIVFAVIIAGPYIVPSRDELESALGIEPGHI